MKSHPISEKTTPHHILVLDDDEEHSNLISRGFENYSLYRISFAKTLADARMSMAADPPDLILADWLLPDGNGIDILQTSDKPITLPLIIMTSHGDEHLAVEMIKVGAIDYLVKSEFMFRDLPRITGRALIEWENIQRRKEAEVALHASEEKFAAIFHANPVANIIVSLQDYRIIDVNRTFEENCGYRRDEVIGKTPMELGLWADSTELERMKRERTSTGHNREGRYHVRTRSGEVRVCIFSSGIITLCHEKCTVSTLVDVTEHEAATQALRESEARFHQIFELGGEALFLIDTETGRICEANKEAEAMYGYRHDELIGLTNTHLSDEPEETRRITTTSPVGSSMIPLRYHRKKDGTVFPVEIAGRFFTYQGSGMYVCAVRDISSRKHAEDALKKSEEWYRRIIETAQEGIWILDHMYLTTYVNPHMADMLGYTLDEMKGRPLIDFLHPDQLSHHEQIIGERKSGITGQFERKYIRKNETICWGLVSSTPLFDDGIFSGAFAMVTDITRRKEVEADHMRMHEDLKEAYDDLSAYDEELQDQYTALRMKQDELVVSEERYRQLFTSMTSGCAHHSIICDETGRPVDYRFIDVNPAFERITGLVRSNILHKTVREILPKTEEYWIELYGKTALTGEVQVFEQFSCAFDKYFEVSAYSPQKGEFITLFTDITARKRTEKALLESEARYRNVVEDQNEFISRSTPDGRYLFVNEAFCRYFNKKREELIGKKIDPGILAEDIVRIRDYFASLNVDNPTGSIDHRTQMPDGEIRWQRWSNRAIFSEEGNLIELQSVGRDITETKKAEEALLKSEEKFRDIVTLAQEGIWAIDPDYNTTYVNPKMAAMLGYTTEEMIGRNLFSFVDEHWMVTKKLHPKRQMQGIFERFEYPFCKKNGELMQASLSVGPIKDESGHVSGALAVVMDITKQKKLQENEQIALRRIEENIHQMAVLNDQIRNPLTVISVMCETDDPPHKSDIMDQINKIDNLVQEVDLGFVESLKIRDFLRDYHGITLKKEE